MSDAESLHYVGTRPIRHDGVDKVTGRANYGADFSLPGMLHGAVLRSPHAHARIVSIDTAAAEAMPGRQGGRHRQGHSEDHGQAGDRAKARSTWPTWATTCSRTTRCSITVMPWPRSPRPRSRSPATAADAVAVVYERAAAGDEPRSGDRADAPILHDDLVTDGTAAADARRADQYRGADGAAARRRRRGFAEADIVVEREFQTPMVHQGYIEPHACVARYGAGRPGGGLVDHAGSVRRARRLRRHPRHRRGEDQGHASEIGGGFGGKIPVYLEPLAVALSRKAHRPVKMVMTRDEVFRATGPTSATTVRMKIGAKRDGTLVAASASLYYEAGAYRGSPSGAGAMCGFASYAIPNFFIEAYDVVVNKPKVAAYRAPGSPMASFATESLIDEIARTHRDGSDRAASQERGRRRRPGAVRTEVRPDRPAAGARGRPRAIRTGRRRSARIRAAAGLRLLVQRRLELERDGLAERRRQRGGRDRQSRHRRHARRAGDDGVGGARHPGRAGAAERGGHRQHRLQRPDRRQPRLLRDRHGRHRGGAGRARTAARPRREDLERRASIRSAGRTDGAIALDGDANRAAHAERAGGQDGAHRRADHRPRLGQSRRWPVPAFGRTSATSKWTRRPASAGRPLHGDSGRRQGGSSELRRGPDAGRRRAGHRLGAERGVRLQRRRASCRTPASSTTACRSPRICR